MDDAKRAAVESVADVLMNDGCGDSDQCERTAQRVVAHMAEAGFVMVRVPATVMVTVTNIGARSDEWLHGFEAGVDAHRIAMRGGGCDDNV